MADGFYRSEDPTNTSKIIYSSQTSMVKMTKDQSSVPGEAYIGNWPTMFHCSTLSIECTLFKADFNSLHYKLTIRQTIQQRKQGG